MKRIGLIAFALLVVALTTPIVLIATLPTARLTIHAIGPTGKFGTATNDLKEMVTGAEWQFGVTNVGGAHASWEAYVATGSKGSNAHDDWWQSGVPTPSVLKPGEGTVINMTVPADEKTEWCGLATCFTLLTPFQTRVWNLGYKTPGLARLLPTIKARYYDEPTFHTTTNATPNSSANTNTP